MLENVYGKIHDGALRYYDEIGVSVPAEIVNLGSFRFLVFDGKPGRLIWKSLVFLPFFSSLADLQWADSQLDQPSLYSLGSALVPSLQL